MSGEGLLGAAPGEGETASDVFGPGHSDSSHSDRFDHSDDVLGKTESPIIEAPQVEILVPAFSINFDKLVEVMANDPHGLLGDSHREIRSVFMEIHPPPVDMERPQLHHAIERYLHGVIAETYGSNAQMHGFFAADEGQLVRQYIADCIKNSNWTLGDVFGHGVERWTIADPFSSRIFIERVKLKV